MDIDKLRSQFPDETSCRAFFESVRWPRGRICPHCGHDQSWIHKSKCVSPGTYECTKCHRHFTVTTKTPLHSTKLPLWKWLQAMYYIASSSKGISSVVLSRWIGVIQATAWKMGHAIRQMMDPTHSDSGLLKGVVELDETYVGGKPVPKAGVVHKRGKKAPQNSECSSLSSDVARSGPCP